MSQIPANEIPLLDESAPFEANIAILNRVFHLFEEYFNSGMDATNLASVASLNPNRVEGTALTVDDTTAAPGLNPGKVIVPEGGTFTINNNSELTNAELTGTSAANTDSGTLYGKMYLSAGTYYVELYKDSGLGAGDLVADGSLGVATGTVTLSEANSSGINGTIDMAYTDDDNSWTITSDLKNGRVNMTGIKFIYSRTVVS